MPDLTYPLKTLVGDDPQHVWPDRLALAATREGWNIWLCSGSSYGAWQICKIDCPDPMDDGFLPPELKSDDEAVRLVAQGEEEHHEAAREFILNYAEEPMVLELQAAMAAARARPSERGS